MTQHYVGVDLGGTNIKAGVVDERGKVAAKESVPTEGKMGRDAVVKNIGDAALAVVKKAGMKMEDVRAIGIGTPGVMDIANGIVVDAPNLPQWLNVPLEKFISDRFHRPTVLENDANAAAWGEYWAGAGKDVDSMVMLTLGTGIGGGIILDGMLWHGHKDAAAELGHVSIDYRGRKCACGNTGCIEAYASANSMVKRFIEAVEAGRPSSLAQAAKDGTVTAKTISQAVKQGDKLAGEIMEETGMLLGVAVVSIVHALNPKRVVLSGGLSNAGEMLMKPLKKVVWERTFRRALEDFDIVFATLGEDAGFIGAAGCALKKYGISA